MIKIKKMENPVDQVFYFVIVVPIIIKNIECFVNLLKRTFGYVYKCIIKYLM